MSIKAIVAIMAIALPGLAPAAELRERISINAEWRFNGTTRRA